MSDLEKLRNELTTEWAKTSPDLAKCGAILNKLRVTLTTANFLPCDDRTMKKELLLTRDVLEVGALWAIKSKDLKSYERYISQLKGYYFDYREKLRDSESPYMYQMIGLYLLYLLSHNRLRAFHTELEMLSPDLLENNVYLEHPMKLEQYIMEGSYNKVFLICENVPADSYMYFMDILITTVRIEIANCMEAAYEHIDASEATRMLYFKSPAQMTAFAKERSWKLNPKSNKYAFVRADTQTDNEVLQVPCKELGSRALLYAKEMEQIV